MSKQHLSNTVFSEFELESTLLQGITDLGFEYCTPIQAETLPFLLKGQDVAGQAQTGTGKTAAFLIATFHYLLLNPAAEHRKNNQPRSIIIAPTRELALQIYKEAVQLGAHLEFTMCAIYGGTGYEQQRKSLQQGTDILIGTPGRIIDYFKQQVFDLKAIQVMVLDEADRMFDLGFIKDIRYLLRRMPKPEQRLNMMFSATLSHRVNELAYEHMDCPQQVVIEAEQITAEGITESVYYPAKEEKIPLLLGLLAKMNANRTMIFINTKRVAEQVAGYLKGNDWDAAVLSGDVPQRKRETILQRFACGELPILIATDVAARGLHIPAVSHVINFDLPQDQEDYVHRIGRTARAGACGDAISFACDEYVFSLPDIESYIGHKLPMASVTNELLIAPKPAVMRPAKTRSTKRNKSHNGSSHKPRSRRHQTR